jgi:molybdopterin-containing oxidoreductase family membrane subunit
MARVIYREHEGGNGFWLALGGFGALIAAGLASAWYMEHHGHVVTGMDNQVVWGLPHVFAVFLIVAASGALNVASMASVFGRETYKPMARFSALLALALLASGLIVLVLDLGRPERLIVAMTTYNFSSIFAWNIFLYTGFMAIVGAYLVTMMGQGLGVFTKPVGLLAFLWRLALTTGTGSIFGWLVAREAYDAAIMAPLFVAMSLAFGTAIFILMVVALYPAGAHAPGPQLIERLGRLLGIFIAVVLYFTAVKHLTNLYAAEHQRAERFILWDGGPITQLFWIVQIGLGSLVPLALVYVWPKSSGRWPVLLASALVVVGGLAQLYVIIIGGQSQPMVLFPEMIETSSFFDGAITAYRPTLPELLLGLGGVALALAVTLVGVKVLRILPTTLADAPAQG